MRASRFAVVAALFASCARWSAPEPDPLVLKPPAPPVARAGEIRVFGHDLPVERAKAIRARLRNAESRLVSEYESVLASDPFAAGTQQVRLGVNRKGEVAEIISIQADVNNGDVESRITGVLRSLEFGSGPEAYVFYTMNFRPDPFEVLTVAPALDADPPALIAHVVNRSAFRLSDLAVTVRIQTPERAAPLRISRYRLRAPFEPGGRRTVHVPLAAEWASDRYSFLLDVRPATDGEPR